MSKISMLLKNFIADCQFKHLRPKTIKSYEQSLMLFSDYLRDLQSIKLVEEIQAKHVLQYIILILVKRVINFTAK
jgi:integrase/recombinase XerD